MPTELGEGLDSIQQQYSVVLYVLSEHHIYRDSTWWRKRDEATQSSGTRDPGEVGFPMFDCWSMRGKSGEAASSGTLGQEKTHRRQSCYRTCISETSKYSFHGRIEEITRVAKLLAKRGLSARCRCTLSVLPSDYDWCSLTSLDQNGLD